MKKISTLFILVFALALTSMAQTVLSVDAARINDGNGIPVDSGMKVQVTGIVYGPDAYPTPNGNAFMLKGDSLGILIYSKRNCGYTLHEGDSVTVVGTLTTFNGTAEVECFNTGYNTTDTIINLHRTGAVLAPIVVPFLTEADESILVQVNNVNMAVNTWASTHNKHSFSVHVGTGTFYLYIDSFMSPDLWQLPAAPVGIYNIVGFGTQYDNSYPYSSGYSLQPRSLADFHQVNVGIHDVQTALAAAVYPNPASTKLTVTFSYDKEEVYTARITDLMGRVVLSDEGKVTTGDNTLEYNTANLNNGMYILEVRTGEKALVTKINIAK